MIARFSMLIVSLAFAACTIEKAPQNPPPAAPTGPAETVPAVATVAPPAACPPVGYWKASGPAGDTEIKVAQSTGKPGSFDVSYKGTNLATGAGHQDGNNFTVDTGAASGGMYTCKLADDCKTMNCGFTGQQPTVFTKSQ